MDEVLAIVVGLACRVLGLLLMFADSFSSDDGERGWNAAGGVPIMSTFPGLSSAGSKLAE